MNTSEVKELLQSNLDYLQNLSVPEYTLYRKWNHLNTDKMKKWYTDNKRKIDIVKNNLWYPSDISDYENLNIDVIPADDPKELLTWRILREMTHSAVWKSSPGRMARYYIVHKEKQKNMMGIEETVNKYLGVISLGSDFLGIGGRDKYIGWTKEDKMKNGMLNHTCMGSSISPTQPLGYNYLGGKLIALMVSSDKVENFWNSKYKEKLAGITTTSLYGGFSQYTRLNYWRKCDSSEGKVKLEPTEDIYDKIKDWYKENHDDYNVLIKGSHPKPKLLSKIYKELGVSTYQNNAPRGVYWCSLYNNTLEFLRGEDTELKSKKFDNSVESLSNLWKEKYAKKRIDKLEKDGKISSECLFYDDLLNVNWETVKEKYISEVGR